MASMSEPFKPKMYHLLLHRQVMVVARTRADGTWKAYCFPVPGVDHDAEEALWETEGSQLPERFARAMFGYLKDLSEMEYAK